MTTADGTIHVRLARPEDADAVEALDSSFTTSTVYRAAISEDGFTLREVPVDPPLTKVFPEEEPDGGDDDPDCPVFLAVDADGALAGFVAVSYGSWNRRLTIWNIAVTPEHRGRGVGRALMSRAEEFARERRAGQIWLEVTNVNAPAIHAYRRMGFSLCGLDTSLYEFTPAAGEYALYMSKLCP